MGGEERRREGPNLPGRKELWWRMEISNVCVRHKYFQTCGPPAQRILTGTACINKRISKHTYTHPTKKFVELISPCGCEFNALYTEDKQKSTIQITQGQKIHDTTNINEAQNLTIELIFSVLLQLCIYVKYNGSDRQQPGKIQCLK